MTTASISQHLRYCTPTSPYYDLPSLTGGRFAESDQPPPPGWERRSDAEWVNLLAPGPRPTQGWKVHVSATPANAGSVLESCWRYCVAHGISFKFLQSREVVHLRSSKYAERTASGKFVTIYTRDDDELTRVVEDLDAELAGQPGPGILTDVRWRNGPLYMRYGAFERLEVEGENGQPVLAVRDPEGRAWPDDRRPGFHPPAWVVRPDVVTRAEAERASGRLTDFPYRPVRALHFSNGGGVYVARDQSGTEVILKEARPFAGLDGSGADAVARLENEAWAHRTLAGVPGVPALLDLRVGHEHHFLVREFVEGQSLANLARRHHPLMTHDASRRDREEFTAWALDVIAQVQRGIEAMHHRDVVFGDLQPSNVLVDERGSVGFIDFESARHAADDSPLSLGTPGYMAPAAFRGTAIDHYALAMMALDTFVPLVRVAAWDESKTADLMAFAIDYFHLPDSFESWLRERTRPDVPRGSSPAGDQIVQVDWRVAPTSWPRVVDRQDQLSELAASLASGIIASADPSDSTRLYPGDPAQFHDAGAGVAFEHGAAGVLWALAATGHSVPPDHVDWLVTAMRETRWSAPGFLTGPAGVAYALAALGRPDDAVHALSLARDLAGERLGLDLGAGLSGIGLAALSVHERTGDPGAAELVDDLTDRVASALASGARGHFPDLFEGLSGAALFLAEQHRRTGDPSLLAAAGQALVADVEEFELRGREALGGDVDPLSALPWIERGAGGIALVAQVLRDLGAGDDPWLGVVERVRLGTRIPLLGDPSLLRGHAGVAIVARRLRGGDEVDRDAVSIGRQLRAIQLHSTTIGDHLSVTGRFDLRASSDLATGAAGVLLALHALNTDDQRIPLT